MKSHHRKNYNDPGHAHELTFSCYRQFPLLKAERSCRWLAEAIETARQKFHFALWAYVFMPDHAHVILWPREKQYDIAAIRKTIKSPVAITALKYIETHSPDWLPHITRRRGRKTEHLFWQSGGGYDRNITGGKALWQMIDYLHLNPVRKHFVAKASDWRWSSAAWYEGVTEDVPLSIA
jgi:putative transposase